MVYHSEHLRMISTHIHTLANVASPPRVSHACAESKTWTDPGIKLPERAPISTERNQSPEQLWINGMLRNRNSGHTVAREFEVGKIF